MTKASLFFRCVRYVPYCPNLHPSATSVEKNPKHRVKLVAGKGIAWNAKGMHESGGIWLRVKNRPVEILRYVES